MKRFAQAAAAAAAAVLVTATASGCSSSSTSSTSSPSPTGALTVKTGSTSLGTILTAANGRTLYLFEADTSKNSTCYGACAAAWPPLLTNGTPQGGDGVQQNLLGTSPRTGGGTQVTYNGHPLYFYAGDNAAGTTNGEDLNQFGAKWYVLNTSGNKVEPSGG